MITGWEKDGMLGMVTEHVYYVCTQALVCFMGAGSVVSHCFDQSIE